MNTVTCWYVKNMKQEVKSYPNRDVSLQFLHFTQQRGDEGGLPTADVAHHCQQGALGHHHVNTANTQSTVLKRVSGMTTQTHNSMWLFMTYLCRTAGSSLAHVNFPLMTVTENSVGRQSVTLFPFELAPMQ